MAVCAVVFLLLSVSIVYFISSMLVKRIKIATDYIVTIADGDFTGEVSDKHMKMKDELGIMIKAVHNMQESVRGMLKAVIDNSEKIDADAHNLSAVSTQMNAASEAVAMAIQEVSAGTFSQAGELGEITEVLNGFGENIEKITASIKDVDSSSKGIMKLTENSNSKMNELADSVESTTRTLRDFQDKIIESGKNINKINEITALINSISEQTNLLALNAAIEAARAGDAGRGFSVVADEIRKLAEQSQDSAANIAELVNSVSRENQVMVDTTKLVGENFKNQRVVIEDTLSSFSNISEAISEVIPKIENINKATLDINDQKNGIIEKVEATASISEETSATTEEISASTQEMSSSSEEVSQSAKNLELRTKEMMEQVDKFKI